MEYFASILIILAGFALLWLGMHDEKGNATSAITGAAAHWVTTDRLIWEIGLDTERIEIRYSPQDDFTVHADSVSGGKIIEVGSSAPPPYEDLYKKKRHIADKAAYVVNVDEDVVRKAVKGYIVAFAYSSSGQVVAATRVQVSGVIDQLFYYDGKLGPDYSDGRITVRLWAPTARSVRLVIYDTDKNRIDFVQPENDGKKDDENGDENDGVWRFSGLKSEWNRKFYRYEISVFHHNNKRINKYEVTDPYSVSLSMDSRFSQFVDLHGDGQLKPKGWNTLKKRRVHPTDISVYEAHVRDFSINDRTVPVEHRGKFVAFTHDGRQSRKRSDGMEHLQRLAEAGLTHLHLLPVNDYATVIEDPSKRVDLHHPFQRLFEVIEHPKLAERYAKHFEIPIREAFEKLAEKDPATLLIQRPYNMPGRTRGKAAYDGYNWGYDPFHFNVPEGSYATDPDGESRILEFRQMVAALHQAGLNVVVDVVYNHTFAAGLSRFSVLDKVVPGYYHRYDPVTGRIERSTCCDNTAAEHAMMEKLIIDSVLLWAKHYKIDAFRFDLMGHHPKYVMENLQQALTRLTMEEHGVDGHNIYIYGEGWNFGEVANNRIFDQATQFNMGSTGIGSFNDRMRDAIRGGNFSSNGRTQGFVSGLYLFPNEQANPNQDENKSVLLDAADRIRVGMSGNLKTYPYINRFGEHVTGGHESIGFTRRPQESVNYIDKHDNETFWDNTQAKLPLDMPISDRVRVHLLGNALINFGQGVPFYQMGTDILRSKSMDSNSFDSGDWFNAVDFSLKTHNWGIGLPPGWDNESRWEEMRVFLTNPAIQAGKEHLELAHRLFREQLLIRYSSPLFRLAAAEEIHRRLAFHNTGPDQEPGIIAMTLSDGRGAGEPVDPELDGILVLFNVDNKNRELTLEIEGQSWDGLELHPVQTNGTDPVVRDTVRRGNAFGIPAFTAVVFVMPQQEDQGDFVCNE